ncbi:hypothetical protein HRR76_000465 [Exophiala dermatitidis]|nr:hypothetical protein HRR76_000465 [Exophiala dermatitidis]KAJ4578108.1 hypothetical protein HRR79_001426 [Exophiala dermatitidis]
MFHRIPSPSRGVAAALTTTTRIPVHAVRAQSSIPIRSTAVMSSTRKSLLASSQVVRMASTHSATAAAAKHDDHGDHGAHHGHEDHYDPPGGWLWGERPGDKYEKEGWEPFAWFFVAAWVVAVAAYTMKEDTSYVAPLVFFALAIALSPPAFEHRLPGFHFTLVF